MPSDRFYGHQDIALLCEQLITTLFSVAPQPPAPVASTSQNVGVGREGIDTPPHSPTLNKAGVPNLGEFIAYALYRTRLPVVVTHQALLLLTRLKTRYPSARGTATSPHRLFLSSLMLSSKISMDDTYSNKSWQIVGQGLFELREVNQMERELFAFLGHNVCVSAPELAAFTSEVIAPLEAKRQQPAVASISSAPSSVKRTASPAATPAPVQEDRKRRRSVAAADSLPSPARSERSVSPDEARHRRASDAAVALLHGANALAAHQGEAASPSGRRRSARTPERPSPYPTAYRSSSYATRGSSASSSASSSPFTSGTATPVSAGPQTPSSSNEEPVLVVPPTSQWQHYSVQDVYMSGMVESKKQAPIAIPPHQRTVSAWY